LRLVAGAMTVLAMRRDREVKPRGFLDRGRGHRSLGGPGHLPMLAQAERFGNMHMLRKAADNMNRATQTYRLRTNSARKTRPFIPSNLQSISCASPVSRIDLMTVPRLSVWPAPF